MNIDIDIYSAIDGSGISIDYDVEAHYETNEHDDLDQDTLRKMKKDIEKLVRDRLNEAMSKNKKKAVNCWIDDWCYDGRDPFEVTTYKDPLTKEITVTKRYRVD